MKYKEVVFFLTVKKVSEYKVIVDSDMSFSEIKKAIISGNLDIEETAGLYSDIIKRSLRCLRVTRDDLTDDDFTFSFSEGPSEFKKLK
jgi:uncharacterized protein YijF (DUF1287 family)